MYRRQKKKKKNERKSISWLLGGLMQALWNRAQEPASSESVLPCAKRRAALSAQSRCTQPKLHRLITYSLSKILNKPIVPMFSRDTWAGREKRRNKLRRCVIIYFLSSLRVAIMNRPIMLALKLGLRILENKCRPSTAA